jgi:hypothetical protein
VANDLFDAVEPRADVLSGALTDAVFAASLDEVVAGSAPPAYGDPATFFASTYPSAGLRTLLDEVLARVGGAQPDNPPVIRLETNLGGGKTHNLIALYHAARGQLDAMTAETLGLMDPAFLPEQPVRQIGVFVGTATGATSFPTIDGISPNTLWGYLALQLGGKTAYGHIRGDDEGLTAAGANDFRTIMGGRPTVILLDEIARYLTTAAGKQVGTKTLADQTVAFLMALMEAVASQANATVVITTTQVTDAFGEETSKVLEAINEAQSLMARQEHVLRPSDEADLPKILARRLFAHIDAGAAIAVGGEFQQAAADAFGRGADLPERLTGTGWAREVADAYPFHPELITVLDKRLSTIPNFQRTRGALRLLARTVRLLWQQQPHGTELIQLHHVDLSDKATAEDLSSRLDRAAYEPVIRADIASQPGGEASHAEQVDAHMGAPFAKRLATATYLYSLTREVPGVPAATLLGAVLAPGDDPYAIMKALDALEQSAWYLHADLRGFRFSVEPSLAKLIQETETQITPGKAKQTATEILAHQFRDSALKVRRTWEDSKVPDRDDDAWLVVLHWDEFGGNHGVGSPGEVPAQVRELWEKTPAGGNRDYRNRLVFLLPSADTHEAMLRAVRRHLALKELAGSSEMLRALPEDKRKELAERAKASDLEARIAVCNHLNVLYVPQASGLEGVELDVVTQASVKPNQTDAVLDRLAAMEKTLTAGDKPLDPGWIKTKLGERLASPLSTLDFVRAFARRSDLKLVLDRAQIAALVGAGVRNAVWEYHDTERGDSGWATRDRPDVSVRLADDTLVCPLGSAPSPGPTTPPGPILPPPPVTTAGTSFSADGKADVAIQHARQQAVDAARKDLRELRLSIDHVGAGAGPELTKLHSVVPPTTPNSTLRYTLSAQIALGASEDSMQIVFAGPPNEYQPLKAALDHVLKQHEAVLKATLSATFDPALAFASDEVEAIKRRATDTGPTRCDVTIVTEDGA